MENEEIVESTPTDTMDSDDDFFAEVDSEVIAEETEEGESQDSDGEEDNEPEVPSEGSEDNSKSEKEVDFKPLLDALKGKIKYNKEEVEVSSIEDLIENYQKGLNYDSLEEMIENGVPEDVAKEVIATSQLRKQLQAKENELKAKEEEKKKEQAKNKEYEDFLKEFPDVNPEDIPKEVFEDAENSSLSNAYMKWQLKEMKNKLEVAKQNEKNSKASVGGVTDTGPTNEKHERDFFLEGFDDE